MRHAAAYWRNKSKEVDGPVHARIINTSSVSGIYGNTGQTNYGVAKAGIAAFTVIAARELKRYGVTVNAISRRRLISHDGRIARTHRGTKRAGDVHPGRVSPAMVWIASLESSDFTGRIVEAGSGLLGIAEGCIVAPPTRPKKTQPNWVRS